MDDFYLEDASVAGAPLSSWSGAVSPTMTNNPDGLAIFNTVTDGLARLGGAIIQADNAAQARSDANFARDIQRSVTRAQAEAQIAKAQLPIATPINWTAIGVVVGIIGVIFAAMEFSKK